MSVLTRPQDRSAAGDDQIRRRPNRPGSGRGGLLARGASAVNVLAGLWLLISPLILDFGTVSNVVAWNSAFIGVIVIAVAAVKVARPQSVGMSWLNVVLGGWLVLSPWVLGEDGGVVEYTAGNINMVLVGMVVMAFAVASSAGTFLGNSLGRRHG